MFVAIKFRSEIISICHHSSDIFSIDSLKKILSYNFKDYINLHLAVPLGRISNGCCPQNITQVQIILTE